MSEGSVAQPPSCWVSLPSTTSLNHTPRSVQPHPNRMHLCRLFSRQSTPWLPTQPLQPPIATTLVDASHSHDQQSNNCLASCTGITKEKNREGRKGGRKKRRKEEKTGREKKDSTR